MLRILNKNNTRIVAILLSSFLCLSNSNIAGIFLGYMRGARLGGITYPIFPDGRYITHADPFMDLTNAHLLLVFSGLFFVFGKVIKKEFFSQFFSIVSISLFLFISIFIYLFKNEYIKKQIDYLNLMQETLDNDLVNITLASILCLYQVIYIIYYWIYQRNRTENL